MTTFNDIKTIANRSNSVNRTPATQKQCAFLSNLINEKLNGSLQDAFGPNHGNMILTSTQASEMISDLLEMEVQAPVSTPSTEVAVSTQKFMVTNSRGIFVNTNGTEIKDRKKALKYAYFTQDELDSFFANNDASTFTVKSI